MNLESSQYLWSDPNPTWRTRKRKTSLRGAISTVNFAHIDSTGFSNRSYSFESKPSWGEAKEVKTNNESSNISLRSVLLASISDFFIRCRHFLGQQEIHSLSNGLRRWELETEVSPKTKSRAKFVVCVSFLSFPRCPRTQRNKLHQFGVDAP